jgi:hypothetical protein
MFEVREGFRFGSFETPNGEEKRHREHDSLLLVINSR